MTRALEQIKHLCTCSVDSSFHGSGARVFIDPFTENSVIAAMPATGPSSSSSSAPIGSVGLASPQFHSVGPFQFAAPSKFDGKIQNWEPFKKKLHAYLCMMNPQFANYLQEVEKMQTTVQDAWYKDSNGAYIERSHLEPIFA